MAKKTTLKHIVDGEVFTRTTSRIYTHVVLAKVDVPARIENIESYRKDIIKQAAKNAAFSWDLAQYNSAHAVDDVSFHGTYIVTQECKDDALKFVAQYGHLTRDQYIQQKADEANQRIDSQIESLKSSPQTWSVQSWAGSRELGMKACSQYERFQCFTRVEEINNGVAA